MKVLLYGYDSVIRKLKSAVTARGDDVYIINGRLDEITAHRCLDEFSFTVVDMTAPQATEVCKYLKSTLETPVIVILGFGEEGWRRIEEVEADGYIHRTAGENEILARLKAVHRRILKPAAGRASKAR
jgi:DNA-binding response OmpR family regulator